MKTAHAIFRVSGFEKGSWNATEGVLCVAYYVALDGVPMCAPAVAYIEEKVKERWSAGTAEFMFWADNISMTGGAPDFIRNAELEAMATKGGK